MDPMLLRTFQKQAALQGRFMLLAATDINKGLQGDNITLTFFAIQNFLNAAANLSKTLWGGGGKREAPRKPLRDSVGITEDSPLKQVAMRNNFEHLDERLERWWAHSATHNICDMNIASRQSIVGVDELGWFRNFDPQTTDVTFWGEDFNIQAIVNELQVLLPKLEAEASKPHWQ